MEIDNNETHSGEFTYRGKVCKWSLLVVDPGPITLLLSFQLRMEGQSAPFYSVYRCQELRQRLFGLCRKRDKTKVLGKELVEATEEELAEIPKLAEMLANTLFGVR